MSTRDARFRIATALEAVVAERSQRAVGNMTGHAGTTIGRWGADLASWPVQALLEVMASDHAFCETVLSALGDLHEHHHHGSAVSSACRTIQATSSLMAQIADDLADGEIDATEAHGLIGSIDAAINQLVEFKGNLGA